MKNFLFIIYIFAMPVALHAQTFEYFLSGPAERDIQLYNGKIYSVYERGVVVNDENGFIFINPTVFPPNNYSDEVVALEVVSPNDIFVATERVQTTAKLKRFNGSEWLDFQPALPTAITKVSDIVYVSENEIYVTLSDEIYSDYGIFKFDGTQWIDMNFQDQGAIGLQVFYVSQTELYATSFGRFWRYDGSNWTFVDSFASSIYKNNIDVVDEDHKFISGGVQLLNFASGSLESLGNLYMPGEFTNNAYVTHVQTLAVNDIYVAVKRYEGFSYTCFVSHWDGNEWERVWSFNTSNQTSDFITYFFEEYGELYAKINNRAFYRYRPNFIDDDGDGVSNSQDSEPNNPTICRDLDGDGCDDCSSTGNNGSGGDTANDGDDFDSDGICDFGDEDDDNDGTLDVNDAFPFNETENTDTDGDGIGNNADEDDDNDGQRDTDELRCGSDPLDETSISPDLDGDNFPDCVDEDIDGDGFSNEEEMACGSDPYNSQETCDTFGVSENNLQSIFIYPNPSSGIIFVKSATEIRSFSVFTSLGKKVINEIVNLKDFEINVTNLSTGLYFLSAEKINGSSMFKFIKK